MTIQPDSPRYYVRGEVDDPDVVHFHPSPADVTVPAELPTLPEAEELVKFHINEWWDADGDMDLRLAHACLVADLAQHTDPAGFAELAWDYHNPMTRADANVWNARVTVYLHKHTWKDTR